MDEDDAARKLSRLELRKQKLMEYLAAKGRLKPPNPKPYLRDDTIKHKKAEGGCLKTCYAAEGKENQGREPLRLRLAEKQKAPPSTGAARHPLAPANILAVGPPQCPHPPTPVCPGPAAPECPHLPAPGATCPVASAQAKPPPPRVIPGPAATLRATKACIVAGPIRAGAQDVTSRNGPKAASTGWTAAESESRPQPVPTVFAAVRTATATSAASAKTISAATAKGRTRPSAAAQPGVLSAAMRAGTQPRMLSAVTCAGTQPKARCDTAVPARTASVRTAPARELPYAGSSFKTRFDRSVPTKTVRITAAPSKPGSDPAAPSKPGTVTTAPSKPSAGKAHPGRGPPLVHEPAPKAPAILAQVPSRKQCAPGPATAKATRCAAFRKAPAPAGRDGPVLRSAGSKPASGAGGNGKRGEYAQNIPGAVNASVGKSVAAGTVSTSVGKPGAAVTVNASVGKPVATSTVRASVGKPVALARLPRHPSLRQRPVPKAGVPQQGRAGESPAPMPPSGSVAFAEPRSESKLPGAWYRRRAAPLTAPPSTVPRATRPPGQPLTPPELRTPPRTGGPGPGIFGTVPARQKKLSAEQEERMNKLQEWRRSKGISYKRPPMPVRPRAKKTPATPRHYWTAMEEEDEAQGLVSDIDRSLADCVKLLQEGCPSEQVEQVLFRVPMAQKFARYWICRARLMEREGDLEVLPLFEEAVRVVMEPVDELRLVVFEILKRKEETSAEEDEGSRCESEGEGTKGEEEEEAQQPPTLDPVTPRAMSVLIRGEKGDSSVVKYKITATPGGSRRSQSQEAAALDGQEMRFFTPVRRSVRIERSAPRYPAALREHDPCVTSYRDLLAEEEEGEDEGSGDEGLRSLIYVYRENEALGDQVQLQYTSGE